MHRVSRADKALLVSSISVFLLMIGNGMLNPILPLYLGTLGSNYTTIGAAIAGFGIGRLMVDGLAGSVSDKVGRRPLILIGIVLFSLSGLLAASAQSGLTVLAARIFQGLGAGCFMTNFITLIGEKASEGERIVQLSLFFGADFLGIGVGPILGGELYQHLSIRAPFYFLTVFSTVALALVFLGIRPPLESTTTKVQLFQREEVKKMLGRKDVLFLDFLGIVILISTSGIRNTAIPLYLANSLGMSASSIGVIVSLIAFANAILLLGFKDSIGRLGGKFGLCIGLFITGVATILYVVAEDFWFVVVMSLVYGVGSALFNPAQTSTVIQTAGPNSRGTYYGFYRLFCDVGSIIGPIMVGIFSALYGLSFSFYVIGLMVILLSITVFLLGNSRWIFSPRQ